MTKDEALKLALEAIKQIDEVAPTAMAKCVIPEIEQALAQRTWVELTREEILEARWHNKSSYKFARVLEAILKEKNT